MEPGRYYFGKQKKLKGLQVYKERMQVSFAHNVEMPERHKVAIWVINMWIYEPRLRTDLGNTEINMEELQEAEKEGSWLGQRKQN